MPKRLWGFHPLWIILPGLLAVVALVLIAMPALFVGAQGDRADPVMPEEEAAIRGTTLPAGTAGAGVSPDSGQAAGGQEGAPGGPHSGKPDAEKSGAGNAAPAGGAANGAGGGDGSGGGAPKAEPVAYTPPPRSAIPNDEFGQSVRLGENVFVHTQQYAKQYVGNGLNCANCHLDDGRLAYSAPMWAAYVLYPKYRKKNDQVNTMEARIQGCFRYSMNGREPAPDSKEMVALVSYFYWLAQGAPTGVKLKGQGYPELDKPAQQPDIRRGQAVYAQSCAICHGANGEGTKQVGGGGYVFPPLWGMDTYNWGAGMHRINTAAGFIKANMPLGQGGSLTDQQAWDVAAFVNSHPRPADPRVTGDLKEGDAREHDHFCYYGERIDGHLLGDEGSALGTRIRNTFRETMR